MSALVRITIPGVQKPHCSAPTGREHICEPIALVGRQPSTVVIALPAILARGPDSYETWAFPSMSTVQQPHCPDGEHPSFGDRTSSSSRRAARRCGWSRQG